MSDAAKFSTRSGAEDIDLTQSLRRLEIPEPNPPDAAETADARLTALLITDDDEIRKWASRWLAREGISVSEADRKEDWLGVTRSTGPQVILVDAGLRDASGELLIAVLVRDPDVHAPVMALSTSSRELTAAIEAGAHDVARKPYIWPVIAKRAAGAAQFGRARAELIDAKKTTAEALRLAETARLRLRNQESFEPLTGLPNKRKFSDLLGRAMHAVNRDGNALAVIVIGFSRFRLVVEAMGQKTADRVLAEVGKRLSAGLESVGQFQVRTEGFKTAAAANLDVGRFALMLTCPSDQDALASLQQYLGGHLSRPVLVDGQTVYLTACLGLALYPQDADTPDELLQRAENAMRDAQSRGGGFKFYCAETDAAAARKLRLEHMLHEALDTGQLWMAFQPIVYADSRGLAGAEALLRWTRPDGECISPEDFIPVAEESALILRIGEFVLDEACRQLRQWLDKGLDIPTIAVNVSRVQLMAGGFADSLRHTLEKHDIPPQRLEIELSERGVLSGDHSVIRQLHSIRELGVRLSIDDFGTGDSAINYLRELPVDILKIDRSYISNLLDDRRGAAMVSAMIALGHSLDLKVVAEGVEREEQLAAVREFGCDALQGFLISRPVDAATFAALITRKT